MDFVKDAALSVWLRPLLIRITRVWVTISGRQRLASVSEEPPSASQYSQITALVAPGGVLGNDNILQIPPAPLYFTPGGVSFLESAGDQINIFAAIGMECTFPGPVCVPTGDNRYGSLSDDGNFDLGIFTLTPVMAAPEPGTATMLLPAVLFFGLFLQRKRLGTGSAPHPWFLK